MMPDLSVADLSERIGRLEQTLAGQRSTQPKINNLQRPVTRNESGYESAE